MGEVIAPETVGFTSRTAAFCACVCPQPSSAPALTIDAVDEEELGEGLDLSSWDYHHDHQGECVFNDRSLPCLWS